MYLSRSIPYWHHPIQFAVSLWTWMTYKNLSHSVMRLRHLRSLVSCCCYTTTRSHSRLQDGPGLKDFIASSGVQSPATGSAEGGLGGRVPYLREEDIAGQGRKGSVVPSLWHEGRCSALTLVVNLAFVSCLGAEYSPMIVYPHSQAPHCCVGSGTFEGRPDCAWQPGWWGVQNSTETRAICLALVLCSCVRIVSTVWECLTAALGWQLH